MTPSRRPTPAILRPRPATTVDFAPGRRARAGSSGPTPRARGRARRSGGARSPRTTSSASAVSSVRAPNRSSIAARARCSSARTSSTCIARDRSSSPIVRCGSPRRPVRLTDAVGPSLGDLARARGRRRRTRTRHATSRPGRPSPRRSGRAVQAIAGGTASSSATNASQPSASARRSSLTPCHLAAPAGRYSERDVADHDLVAAPGARGGELALDPFLDQPALELARASRGPRDRSRTPRSPRRDRSPGTAPPPSSRRTSGGPGAAPRTRCAPPPPRPPRCASDAIRSRRVSSPSPVTAETAIARCRASTARRRRARDRASCRRPGSAWSRASVVRAELLADGRQVGRGIRRRQVHDQHERSAPADVAQEPMPEALARVRALDEPGTSATTNRSSSPRHAEVGRRRGERVVGDLRVGGREARRAASTCPRSAGRPGRRRRRCAARRRAASPPQLAAFGTLRHAVARGGERAFPRPPRPPRARTARAPSPTRSASRPCSSLDPVPSGTGSRGPRLRPRSCRACRPRPRFRPAGAGDRRATPGRGPRSTPRTRRRRRGRRRPRPGHPGVVRLAQDRRRSVAAVAPTRRTR